MSSCSGCSTVWSHSQWSHTSTQYNKQGDFELLDRDTYRPIKHGTPDMGTLIQVMNELNRFYRAP